MSLRDELDAIRSRLLRKARSLDRGDPEDLVHRVLLLSLERELPLDEALLTTMLWREHVSRRRSVLRRSRREGLWARDLAPPAGAEAEFRSRLREVEASVAGLPETLRAVIELGLQGHASGEIARQLGIPAGTVRWRRKQAIERLRDRRAACAMNLTCIPGPHDLGWFTWKALLMKYKLTTFAVATLVLASAALVTTSTQRTSVQRDTERPLDRPPANVRHADVRHARRTPPPARKLPSLPPRPTWAPPAAPAVPATMEAALAAAGTEVTEIVDACQADLETNAGVFVTARVHPDDFGAPSISNVQADSNSVAQAECVAESMLVATLPDLGETGETRYAAAVGLSREEGLAHFAQRFFDEAADAPPQLRRALVDALVPARHAAYLQYLTEEEGQEMLSWMPPESAKAFEDAAMDLEETQDSTPTKFVEVAG